MKTWEPRTTTHFRRTESILDAFINEMTDVGGIKKVASNEKYTII